MNSWETGPTYNEGEVTSYFAKFVDSLAKDPSKINETLNETKLKLWHAATGISSESGELLDEVKKIIVNNKPIDADKLLDETGDVLHYVTALLNSCGYSIEDAMSRNIVKLRKRFPSGKFTDEAAILQLDKKDRPK